MYFKISSTNLAAGYILHDKRVSTKMHLAYRRIKAYGEAYMVLPGEAMPYFTRTAKESFFPTLLLRHGVPPEILAMGFGKDAVHFYRQFQHLGHFELEGPRQARGQIAAPLCRRRKNHLLARPGSVCLHHRRQKLPTGACPVHQRGRAYGVFRTEAQRLSQGFAPLSVQTNGWLATCKGPSLCCRPALCCMICWPTLLG